MNLCVKTACCLLAALASAGCGESTQQSFSPKAALAKDAVAASLERWKAGEKPGRFTPTAGAAAIEAVDGEWMKGSKLDSFELGAETAGAGPTKIAVTLTIEGKPPVQTEYFVFGKDPLWVYRDADYAKAFEKGM
ncbi:MAG TPA: hypothetical protein VNC50_18095 [Planctomycetia bacterium]|nr:hypothetical protein [Planctomycetia bacterium]